MLMSLRTKLKYREDDPRGTVYIIDRTMDFSRTDGYIQFINLALDNIEPAYGKQSRQWEWQREHIRGIAERLCDTNIRFAGSTKDQFAGYCEKVAHILRDGHEGNIPRLKLIKKEGSLKNFMEQQVAKGRNLGFVYDETENTEKLIMHDLMDQLSQLKLQKSSRQYDISPYLCDTMYHEHVHDALNFMIHAAVYFINCRSTQECAAFDFDIMEMDNRLDHVEDILKYTEHVV